MGCLQPSERFWFRPIIPPRRVVTNATAGVCFPEAGADAITLRNGGDVNISARVRNGYGEHHADLTTNDKTHSIDIPPKTSGPGSSANGRELLFLALATCYCNDIYREAARRGIAVEHVEVNVDGDFGAAGEPARNVTYRASVVANASEADIRDLMRQTDVVSEIQNTLRAGTPITLTDTEAVTSPPELR